MVSDKFRRQLRQEADRWRSEGAIDADLYEQLSERYQFNALEASARNRFVTILMGLGSILIGLGVITFVAANWQGLPPDGKVTLLLSLFIGVNIAGFYLWKQPQGGQQRLGHGLLLLGALLLGANMGLMSQIFGIDRPFYQLLLAWGVGVLAMAYSLRLTSLGVLSIILVGLGYWGFWRNSVEPISLTKEFDWSLVMVQHMPLWAGLMFVPLAYWCRSRAIFALAAIAVIFSVEANLLFSFRLFDLFPFIAFALPPALLWGYDDSVWVEDDEGSVYATGRHEEAQAASLSPPAGSFQPIARSIALVFLSILLFSSSFSWFWENFVWENFARLEPKSLVFKWFPLVDALILSLLAVYEWLPLVWQARNPRTRTGMDLTTVVIGVLILLAAAIPFWHINVAPIPPIATFIFNVLLFLFAGGLMREGLVRVKRYAFWGGMVLLTLRILSWFLLLNVGLMFKSLIFILGGVGAIAVGFWFDRYVRTLSSTPKTRRNSQSSLSQEDSQ